MKNMRKKEFKRIVCYSGGFLLLCLLLYSCLQDEWKSESNSTTGKIIEGQNRELTISVARSWYEANQAPVVATRSVVTNFELMTKLRWKQASESRKGDFEVVEVPLLTRGGAVLLDQETKDKYNPETDRKKIRNISRMVIIKNLRTGEITNFVMYIVGTYDYLKKAKHFGKNSYLYRDRHLSGSVCFYKPEGGLVNGWKYKDGKIVGAIHQGTEKGLQMQSVSSTRSYQDCYFDYVLVEYNDCEGFTYDDPEYGLGFGSECTESEKWELQEVCIEIDDGGGEDSGDDWYPTGGGGNSGGSSSGGQSGSGSTSGGYRPPVAPKAKAIFRNSSMTETSWKAVEKMLDKMTATKIGKALYDKLQEVLKGKTLIIQFVDGNITNHFDPNLGSIKMRMDITSSALLHEMVHVLQSYTEQEAWNATQLNRELEAHLIQQIYINSLSESERSWWYEQSKYDSRWNATRILETCIDEYGNLLPEITAEQLQEIIPKVISGFRDVGYDNINYPWLNSRKGLDNFKNLRSMYQ